MSECLVMEAAPTKAKAAADKRPHIDVGYPLISTSQVSNFDDCARKWGFVSLMKLRTPSSSAAELGDDTDTGQLQPYLSEGRPFDFTRPSGYIAASCVRFLPKPRTPGLEVQWQFIMPAPERPGVLPTSRPSPKHKYEPKPAFGYLGYLDMWAPDSSVMPGLEDPLNVRGVPDPALTRSRFTSLGYAIPLVGDFKTTKHWKYKKSPEQIDKDNQAMLYATWAMWATGADVVDLAWIYMRTTGAPVAERTFRRTTLDRVLPEFARIDKTAREMIAIKQAAPPRTEAEGPNYADTALLDYINTLEPNTSSCSKFGGCPFQLGQCNLTSTATVDSLEHADAARRNRGRVLPIIQPTPDGASIEDFLDMTTSGTKSTADFLAEMKAKRAGVVATPTTAPAPATTGAINPPEASLPPADPVGAVTAQAPTGETPAAVPAPTKRGRPKKATPEATPSQAEAPPVAAPPVAADERQLELAVFTPPERDDAGLEFTVTWPEERFVKFNSFGVGGHKITAVVQPGQTLEQAMAIAHNRLGKIVQDQFATHAQAFQSRAAIAAGALEKAAA